MKLFDFKNQFTIAYLPEIGKTNGSTGFGFTFDPPANPPTSTQFSQNHRFMIEEKINISEKKAKLKKPDYFLVLPWHFKDSIINREAKFLKSGGKMIFPLPEIEII